ncbi:hypothetical protein JCM10212_002665 [Sporobolomyces blumeae]
MVRSLLVVALVALASPAFAAASPDVAADQSPAVAAPFQLNLAKRFTSTIDQLKKRGGDASVKVSRAKERSLSDELMALLALAAYNPASPSQHTAAAKPSAAWTQGSDHTHAAAKPTGSRKPSTASKDKPAHALAGKPYNKNGPSKALTHAAAAGPTHTDHHGAKPRPSAAYNTHAAVAPSSAGAAKPAPSAAWTDKAGDHTAAALPANPSADHNAKRSSGYTVEEVQKRIQDEPWENLDSQLLCPLGETACPIFPRMGTYECIDTSSELENCGGCASKSLGEDCTSLQGALGVTCQSGKCNVFTCQSGYEFDSDGRDGHGECRSTSKPSAARRFFGSAIKRE